MRTVADIRLDGDPGPMQLTPEYKRSIVWLWLRQFGNVCLFCDEFMTTRGKPGPDNPLRATVDHINAECLGGDNSPGNLQVVCWQCNHDKGVAEDMAAD